MRPRPGPAGVWTYGLTTPGLASRKPRRSLMFSRICAWHECGVVVVLSGVLCLVFGGVLCVVCGVVRV
jgi:hypothetical protein